MGGNGGSGDSSHTSPTNGQPGTAGVAGAGGTGGDGGGGGGAWDTLYLKDAYGGDGGIGGDGGNGALPLNIYALIFQNLGSINADGQNGFGGADGLTGLYEFWVVSSFTGIFYDHAGGGGGGGGHGGGGDGGDVTVVYETLLALGSIHSVGGSGGSGGLGGSGKDTEYSVNKSTQKEEFGASGAAAGGTGAGAGGNGGGSENHKLSSYGGENGLNGSAGAPGTVTISVSVTCYADTDGDGYGELFSHAEFLSCPAGYVSDNTDCNDSDFDVNLGVAEATCDSVDNDCNPATLDEPDLDSDGWSTCLDCNDADSSVNPGAIEVCNGVDDNCDGNIDEGVLNTYYQDSDGDGFGNIAVNTQACSQPTGYVSDNTDCNDADSSVNPGAVEVCNDIDDNCDGNIDEGLSTATYYLDIDNDGYGDPLSSIVSCSQPPGYVPDNTDCNDADSSVNPGAAEVTCDSVDNDCNPATLDEPDLDNDGWTTCVDCDDNDSTIFPRTYYADLDGDGYGDPLLGAELCSPPPDFVLDSTDCNDGDSSVNPGATEVCNGIDDNCDGNIDEGVITTYYTDLDGDGYGDPLISLQACSPPAGFVPDSTDCNDGDSSVNPGAAEVCNGIDDNCDGNIDEGVLNTYYQDSDGDGFGNIAVTTEACSQPSGFVSDNTDCDDTDMNVNPGAAEVCNGIDDNCDGNIDEGVLNTYYDDADSDGFGNPASSVQACTAPPEFVSNNTDCDDTDATIYPGAPEIPNDGIDQNCDGADSTSCCMGDRGDANNDGANANILDLTFLVDFIFRSGPDAVCPEEADMNSDGSSFNILDLTFIVDFIFRSSGQPPDPCYVPMVKNSGM